MVVENTLNIKSGSQASAGETPANRGVPLRGDITGDVTKDIVFQTMLAARLDASLDALCALNGWAISPELGLWLLDFIEGHCPQRLIELGSGVSTLIIADGLRKQAAGGKVLSIEHSEKYYEATKFLLEKTGLTDFVSLKLCPIDSIVLNGKDHQWYRIPTGTVQDFLGKNPADLLLVDGPPKSTQEYARYPALPVLRQFLSTHSLILLDDAAREDESEVAKRWIQESGGRLTCEMLSHFRRGPALIYASELPRMRMSENIKPKTSAISVDNIVGPMSDYVTQLVNRNLLRLEVAEGIALKHHLLLQMEDGKRVEQLHEHKRLAMESASSEAQVKRINAALEMEIGTLRAEIQEVAKRTEAEFEIARIRHEADLAEAHLQRDDAVHELQAARAELDALKHSQTALVAEHTALGARVIAGEARWTELNERFDTLRKLNADLKARGATGKSQSDALKATIEESSSMSKEVFALVDTLQKELSVSRYELEQTQLRLERTKLHLSYRLGGVLVNNSGSLAGVLSIPRKLLHQKREFSESQRRAQLVGLKPTGPKLAILEGINYAYARTRWRPLQLNSIESGGTLLLTLLTPSAGRTAALEISCEQAGAVYFEASVGQPRQPIGQEPISFDLVSDGGSRTLRLTPQTGPVVLSLRKVAGGAAIVKVVMQSGHIIAGGHDTPKLMPIQSTDKSRISLASASSAVAETKPMKSAIIWQAHQMMEKGYVEEAIAFAKKHARDFVRPAVELLVANSQKHREVEWLQSVNRYLAQFEISPVELASEGGNKFLRLLSNRRSDHKEGPLVSVIMPAFNSAATIEHSIRSILNQSWRNIELFVIDDASEDRTCEVVKKIAAQDTRVKVLVNKKNVGPYVSKNMALQFCQGKYITGHDADDWAHPERIAGQVIELMRSGGQLKGNMAKMIRMMADGTFVHFAKEGKTSDDGVLRDAAISCMFEREFFRQNLGHWDCVRFGADSELISRAQKILQSRFVKLRHMTMICLDNEGSLTNDPVHGVSKSTGISPTRKFYRDQWMAWHGTMDPVEANIPFPYILNRKFAVPDAAAVLNSDIVENLRSIESYMLRTN